MNKEVFTQEFDKAFTIYQQVELIKKYLGELVIPEPVDTTQFLKHKYENEEFKGEIKWNTTENADVSLDVSVYDTNKSTHAGYLHVGDYSAYLDNNYWRIGLDNDYLTIRSDVMQGMYFTGNTDTGCTRVSMGVGGVGADDGSYINIDYDEGIAIYSNSDMYINTNSVNNGHIYINSPVNFGDDIKSDGNIYGANIGVTEEIFTLSELPHNDDGNSYMELSHIVDITKPVIVYFYDEAEANTYRFTIMPNISLRTFDGSLEGYYYINNDNSTTIFTSFMENDLDLLGFSLGTDLGTSPKQEFTFDGINPPVFSEYDKVKIIYSPLSALYHNNIGALIEF